MGKRIGLLASADSLDALTPLMEQAFKNKLRIAERINEAAYKRSLGSLGFSSADDLILAPIEEIGFADPDYRLDHLQDHYHVVVRLIRNPAYADVPYTVIVGKNAYGKAPLTLAAADLEGVVWILNSLAMPFFPRIQFIETLAAPDNTDEVLARDLPLYMMTKLTVGQEPNEGISRIALLRGYSTFSGDMGRVCLFDVPAALAEVTADMTKADPITPLYVPLQWLVSLLTAAAARNIGFLLVNLEVAEPADFDIE